MWTRYAGATVTWKCISTRGYKSKIHVVEISVTDTYRERPSEDIGSWADRVGEEVASHMCKEACESLSTSVFCDESSPDHTITEGPTQETDIPSDVLANIEVILRKINENRDDVDYVNSLIGELDRILDRNDLSRDDIRDLIDREGVGDLL